MADVIETAIDRTQILDVEKLWPKPSDCPDWPLLMGHQRYGGRVGRVGAEEKLEQLSAILNRSGKVHAPSEHEREAAFDRVFIAKGNAFHYYGLQNLSALNRLTEDQAQLIVEAAHVRGYLRKLDAQEAKAKARAEEDKIASARKTLDGYHRLIERTRAELAERAEAEARHRQRIEDEQAAAHCAVIRKNAGLAYPDAAKAAAVLGVDAPPRPNLD